MAAKKSRLEKAREALDLSQQQVAQKSNISQSFYSALERGDAMPTIEVARRVAAALDKSVDQLWPPVPERASA